MPIVASELVLNQDGSLYHINLKPENLADTVIFVGDQDRVERISSYFDAIDFEIQKREFKTHTGTYKGKRISVISTGIGPDNIDIVMNELDALVNIDLQTRQPKEKLKSLDIIRVGTSGSLQPEVPTDGFLLSTHGIDLNGLLHFYEVADHHHEINLEKAFIRHLNWHTYKAYPYIFAADQHWVEVFQHTGMHRGITATAGGFYGPQGRVLRLPLSDADQNDKLASFQYHSSKITNYEMETAVIYGLAKLLGHKALSLNAIIANRLGGTFSQNPYQTVDKLIKLTLDTLTLV